MPHHPVEGVEFTPCAENSSAGRHFFDVIDGIPPVPDVPRTAGPAADEELDRLLASHPWLEGLEPFCIDWELIWVM